MNTPHPPLVVIAGPTASGKSALAMALAERNDGVVINADSVQVYRDLRIVAARPSPEDEARAPHRLFGHVDAADSGYNAVRWAAESRAVIAEVHASGKLPILVGGTGLYLRTLLDGIAPVPPIDPAIRAAVRALAVGDAHAELVGLDPPAAERLHPNDTTRVHRALEVIRSTGQPITTWRERRDGGIGDAVSLIATVLLPPRDWLQERIRRRAADIVAIGRDEINALLARDLPADAPILCAIGVPELARLVRGESDATETIEALALATRRYAKRQYTWFRRQTPSTWAQISDTNTSIIDSIETKLRRQRLDAQP